MTGWRIIAARGLVAKPDYYCPVVEDSGDPDQSWDYPIGELGSARDGFSNFNVVLEANMPIPAVEMRVSVGGRLVRSDTKSDGPRDGGGYSVWLTCYLAGAPDSVHFELVGAHPGVTLSVYLQSPTPENKTVCAV